MKSRKSLYHRHRFPSSGYPGAQVFVYNGEGEQLAIIEVPARPQQLIFGGEDGDTLHLLTHHALSDWTSRPVRR